MLASVGGAMRGTAALSRGAAESVRNLDVSCATTGFTGNCGLMFAWVGGAIRRGIAALSRPVTVSRRASVSRRGEVVSWGTAVARTDFVAAESARTGLEVEPWGVAAALGITPGRVPGGLPGGACSGAVYLGITPGRVP